MDEQETEARRLSVEADGRLQEAESASQRLRRHETALEEQEASLREAAAQMEASRGRLERMLADARQREAALEARDQALSQRQAELERQLEAAAAWERVKAQETAALDAEKGHARELMAASKELLEAAEAARRSLAQDSSLLAQRERRLEESWSLVREHMGGIVASIKDVGGDVAGAIVRALHAVPSFETIVPSSMRSQLTTGASSAGATMEGVTALVHQMQGKANLSPSDSAMLVQVSSALSTVSTQIGERESALRKWSLALEVETAKMAASSQDLAQRTNVLRAAELQVAGLAEMRQETEKLQAQLASKAAVLEALEGDLSDAQSAQEQRTAALEARDEELSRLQRFVEEHLPLARSVEERSRELVQRENAAADRSAALDSLSKRLDHEEARVQALSR